MVYRISCIIISLWLYCAYLPAQTISGIINSYAPVLQIDSTACCSKVILESALDVSAGDRVMIIQMKGAVTDVQSTPDFGRILSYNSAGNYEFATVHSTAAGGTVINLDNWLQRQYEPRFAVQLIRVPRYTAPVTVEGKLTAAAWDGKVGGVLVFEAPGQPVTLNAEIDVSGLGFRGGEVSAPHHGTCASAAQGYVYSVKGRGPAAFKGEGIASNDGPSLRNYELGRGALANGGGGGNSHNAGGAGGGNAGVGGTGGATYTHAQGNGGCVLYPYGGRGGSILVNTVDQVFLGGGGGGGDNSDIRSPSVHYATSGGAGGGILVIRVREIIGSGYAVRADGAGVTELALDDGAGGGGAGGTIIVETAPESTALVGLTISVRGGVGGNVNSVALQHNHGPGGGGGGGIIRLSNSQAIITTLTDGGDAGFNLPSYLEHEATAGSAGITQRSPFQLPEAGACLSHSIVSITSDTTICPGTAVLLQVSDGISYFWSPPDGLSCTDCANPQASPSTTTTYTVRVFSDIDCENTASVTVTVYPLPQTTIANDTGICRGDSTQLYATGGISYQWSPPINLSCTSCANPVASPSTTTTYYVDIFDGICTVRDSILVVVNEDINDRILVALGDENVVAYTPDITLDLKAESESWDRINVQNLVIEIAYKKQWMRYGGNIIRGPALDPSWQFNVQEHNGSTADEHIIVITATGDIPIAADGTIATVHIQLLLSQEHIYTPVVTAEIPGREGCLHVDGKSGTIDMSMCVQNLRQIVYTGVPYRFELLGGTLVSHTTTVLYSTAIEADTRIEVYNQFGQLVSTFEQGIVPVGEYSKELDLRHLAAGVYIIRYTSGPYSKTLPFVIGAE